MQEYRGVEFPPAFVSILMGIEDLDPISGDLIVDSHDFDSLLASKHLLKTRHRRAYEHRMAALSQYNALVITLAKLKRIQNTRKNLYDSVLTGRSKHDIISESGVAGEMSNEVTNPETVENLQDLPGADLTTSTAGSSVQQLNVGQYEKFALEQFLSRPVQIDTTTYTASTVGQVVINPWSLWSMNAAVRTKLSNYSYFTGDMFVQFNLSGTPFSYGRLLVGYLPYYVTNSVYAGYEAMAAGIGTLVPGNNSCFNNWISQLPGSFTLDFNENEPVVLKLPFISYKQTFRLFNSSTTVITNSDSFADFSEAGALIISVLNSLRVANTDSSAEVALTVYAWCENVTLGNPTATNINITAESGVSKRRKTRKVTFSRAKQFIDSAVGDEYDTTGPVSSVASAIGGAALALQKVPFIGGFMTATNQIATMVGKVSSWFGLSKPVLLEKPIYVKNNPFQNGCVTSNTDTTYKIAVDPKQELSLSSDICAEEGPDNMSIVSIASRPTYIATFEWSQTDTPMTTILWQVANSPYLYTGSAKPVGTNDGTAWLIQPSALMFAATPFTYWRGCITYRFEIVCSRFHRGKFLIAFEPNLWQDGLIGTAESQLNQQNHVLVDIQETTFVEVTVEWASTKAWLKVSRTKPNPAAAPFKSEDYNLNSIMTYALPSDKYAFNGMLYVRPFTRLVEPNAETVSINVYVYCNDLQVARPTGASMANTRSYVVSESGMSRTITSVDMNETDADMEGLHLHHFGEMVPSFRALMKRYATYYSDFLQTSAAGMYAVSAKVAIYSASKYPVGADVDLTTGDGVLMEGTSLFDYLRFSYLGVRGGMRFRVMGTYSEPGISSYTRLKYNDEAIVSSATLPNVEGLALNVIASQPNLASYMTGTFTGSLSYHVDSNGGVEFELPFYNSQLFVPSANNYYNGFTNISGGLGWDEVWGNVGSVNYLINSPASGKDNMVVVDRAAAEDFNFMRFQAASFYSVTTT